MRILIAILLFPLMTFGQAFTLNDPAFAAQVASPATNTPALDGTPVDLLIMPTGTNGTLVSSMLMSNYTIGATGSYAYVDDFTPTHTFVTTNAVFTRRTPFRIGSTLYSNNTHGLLFDMAHPNAVRNEGFVWSPAGIPTFAGVSATMTFKIVHATGNHNFDLLHLQSGNYGVAQLQIAGGTYTIVAHSEPGHNGAIGGIQTNVYYNLHSRMNVADQKLEIALVKSDTGELVGAASKDTDPAQPFGDFLYLKIQDYLWNAVDPVALEMGMIALDWTHKTFPLEPISVPTPQDLYVTQIDTNVLRLTWTGRGVAAQVERNAGSGFVNVTNHYVSPLGMGPNSRVYYDSNVTEGVTYQYRVTSQVGDYASASSVSTSVLVTNSHPGFDVVWQEQTNIYQFVQVNTATDFPAIEQHIKAVNTETVLVSRATIYISDVDANTVTNGEMLQLSFFSETNRGGIHYGTSRGTIISTNLGEAEFVFFDPVAIPPGSNFWISVEGNWPILAVQSALDYYRPDEGFNLLFHGSEQISGVTADLYFKIRIKYTPVAPVSLVATQTVDGQVSLTWPDSNQGLARYKIDQYHGSWTDGVTNVSGTNVIITGLTAGETYNWRVYAYAEGVSGSESSKTVSGPLTVVDFPDPAWVDIIDETEPGLTGEDAAAYLYWTPITLTTGTAKKLRIYVQSDPFGGRYPVKIGLYNSSGTLLRQVTIANVGAVGWHEGTIADLSVTAGGYYLGWLTQLQGQFQYGKKTGIGITSSGDFDQSYAGAMPSTLPTADFTFDGAYTLGVEITP